MSNRPNPFEAAQRAAPFTRANQGVNSKPASAATPVATSPKTQSPSVVSGVTRDDVVRAVMPELQTLLRHLVVTGIDRAIAPLLEKQRELEAAVTELRNAQTRPEPRPNIATAHNTAARTDHTPLEATAPRPAQLPDAAVRTGATAIAHPAPNMRSSAMVAPAFDTAPLEDIPLELNGSRRKKTILWAIGVAVLLALISAVVLSVLSNQGTYL